MASPWGEVLPQRHLASKLVVANSRHVAVDRFDSIREQRRRKRKNDSESA
jgi:hypothetical protein